MAKATRANGPTYTEDEVSDPEFAPAPVRVRRPELGQVDRQPFTADDERGDPPSAPEDGTDSSESSEKSNSPEETSKPSNLKPARTTGNRSRRTAQGSAASSTGGSGQKVETAPSSEAPADEDEDEFEEFA